MGPIRNFSPAVPTSVRLAYILPQRSGFPATSERAPTQPPPSDIASGRGHVTAMAEGDLLPREDRRIHGMKRSTGRTFSTFGPLVSSRLEGTASCSHCRVPATSPVSIDRRTLRPCHPAIPGQGNESLHACRPSTSTARSGRNGLRRGSRDHGAS